MPKSKTRRISRKVDLDKMVLDGDMVAKLTYIVGQSRDNDDSKDRYYNDADFIERAVESAVNEWEEKNHKIDLAPSGLSVIPHQG